MIQKGTLIFSLAYLFVAAFIIWYFDGTADAGDSVKHYLVAHSAFDHPHLFFFHWGKPVFTLLAAPFARFGFDGMKCFNVLVTLLTLLCSLQVVRRLGYSNAWLAPFLLLSAPFHLIVIFSGLTEPLFALFMVGALYLALCREQWAWAVILLSFMPFVRSEGMIICGVFGLYLMWKGRWSLLPLFALGHVIYIFAGGLVTGNYLWIINENPYAAMHRYLEAEAHLFDFAERLTYVIGIPLYGLLVLGLLSFLWKPYNASFKLWLEELWLIVGCFAAFFTAHTLFWYLGIFNSMGLKRVLIGVLPLIGILALRGFNFVQHLTESQPLLRRFLFFGILAYTFIFPFTSNPAALGGAQAMRLLPEQRTAVEVADFIRQSNVVGEETTLYYTHPSLSMPLGVDHFDPAVRRDLDDLHRQAPRLSDLIIWDSWYGVVDSKWELDALTTSYDLESIGQFESTHHRYVLLKMKKN
ncbi:MAG: hypothetical protein AAF990_03785 [Bacteroidota bacterium]